MLPHKNYHHNESERLISETLNLGDRYSSLKQITSGHVFKIY